MPRERREWTQYEDARLLRAIEEIGGCHSWREIAEKAKIKRTDKQCRDRWIHSLNPNLNREPFSEEEDEKIIRYLKEGRRITDIAASLKGRSSLHVKNRIISLRKIEKEEKGKELLKSWNSRKKKRKMEEEEQREGNVKEWGVFPEGTTLVLNSLIDLITNENP